MIYGGCTKTVRDRIGDSVLGKIFMGQNTPLKSLRVAGLSSCLLLSCLILGGCVSPIDGGRGFAPFYESTPLELSPLVDLKPAASPTNSLLTDQTSSPQEVHLWPIYSQRTTPTEVDTRFLWPIGRDTIQAHQRRTWLLPLYIRRQYLHGDGTEDVQTLLLPAYWGRDSEAGSYFSVFPIGGTAKSILGQDRIDYALFPLWARAQDRDRVSQHFLFPIFNWTTGARIQGGRVFPFYSRYRGYTPDGTLRYDRRSYLWPFIHKQESDLETDDPTETRWYWPFWGHIRSERVQRWSVAWPFLGMDSYPKREWKSYYLFPLFRFTWKSDELVQYDFYPLFGHREWENNSRDFFLWPLFGRESQEAGAYSRKARWFFPFYRQVETRHHGEERSEKMTRVWPFYRYRGHSDGRQEWHLIDPLPFVDRLGFDAFYSRIWRIYREVDDPSQQRRAWELLWGLAGGSREPSRRQFSILGGLFGRETVTPNDGEPEETTWRILYLSF